MHEEYRTKLFDLDEYIVTNYDKEMNDEIQTVRDQQIDRDRNHINEIMILAAEKRQAITKLLESDYDE